MSDLSRKPWRVTSGFEFFQKDDFFFERQNCSEGGIKVKKVFDLSFHSQTARAVPAGARNLEPAAPSGSSAWVKGPRGLSRPLLLPRAHRQGARWEAEELGTGALMGYWLGSPACCTAPALELEL